MVKTVDEFLDDFKDILQTDDDISSDTELTEIEEWDSLAMMALLAYFDRKLLVKISFNNLADCDTISDVIVLSKGSIV